MSSSKSPEQDPSAFDAEEGDHIEEITVRVPAGAGKETIAKFAEKFTEEVLKAKRERRDGHHVAMEVDTGGSAARVRGDLDKADEDAFVTLAKELIQSQREDRKAQLESDKDSRRTMLFIVLAGFLVLGGAAGVATEFFGFGASKPSGDGAPPTSAPAGEAAPEPSEDTTSPPALPSQEPVEPSLPQAPAPKGG